MGVHIELRHLRYFLAVAEELNFSRAAERLHIAPRTSSPPGTALLRYPASRDGIRPRP